jgi:hypothetical protein
MEQKVETLFGSSERKKALKRESQERRELKEASKEWTS